MGGKGSGYFKYQIQSLFSKALSSQSNIKALGSGGVDGLVEPSSLVALPPNPPKWPPNKSNLPNEGQHGWP